MKHAMIFGTEVPCLENNNLVFFELINRLPSNANARECEYFVTRSVTFISPKHHCRARCTVLNYFQLTAHYAQTRYYFLRNL